MTRPAVRKMWMNTPERANVACTTKPINDWQDPHPFVLLDPSPEAVEGCVEAMADAISVSL